MFTINNEKMRNRKEAAEYLGFKSQTLAKWACTGEKALRYYKLGKNTYYKEQDLINYMEACVR